jgi:hypothetical protein
MPLNTIMRYVNTFKKLNDEQSQQQNSLFSNEDKFNEINTKQNNSQQDKLLLEQSNSDPININSVNFSNKNNSTSIDSKSNSTKNYLSMAIENTKKLDESKMRFTIINFIRNLLNGNWHKNWRKSKERDSISFTEQLIEQLDNIKDKTSIQLKDKNITVTFSIKDEKIIFDKNFEVDANQLKKVLIKNLIDIIFDAKQNKSVDDNTTNEIKNMFDNNITNKMISFIINNVQYIRDDSSYIEKFEEAYFRYSPTKEKEIKKITDDTVAEDRIKDDINRSFTYILDEVIYNKENVKDVKDLKYLIEKLNKIGLLNIIGISQGLLVNSFISHLGIPKDFNKTNNNECCIKYTITIKTSNTKPSKIYINSSGKVEIVKTTNVSNKIYATIDEETEVIQTKINNEIKYKLKQISLENIIYEFGRSADDEEYTAKYQLKNKVEKLAENYRKYVIDGLNFIDRLNIINNQGKFENTDIIKASQFIISNQDKLENTDIIKASQFIINNQGKFENTDIIKASQFIISNDIDKFENTDIVIKASQFIISNQDKLENTDIIIKASQFIISNDIDKFENKGIQLYNLFIDNLKDFDDDKIEKILGDFFEFIQKNTDFRKTHYKSIETVINFIWDNKSKWENEIYKEIIANWYFEATILKNPIKKMEVQKAVSQIIKDVSRNLVFIIDNEKFKTETIDLQTRKLFKIKNGTHSELNIEDFKKILGELSLINYIGNSQGLIESSFRSLISTYFSSKYCNGYPIDGKIFKFSASENIKISIKIIVNTKDNNVKIELINRLGLKYTEDNNELIGDIHFTETLEMKEINNDYYSESTYLSDIKYNFYKNIVTSDIENEYKKLIEDFASNYRKYMIKNS